MFIRFICLCCLFVSLSAHAEQPQRPNILLIMADDLGFSDLACYGGEIATPNLNSIAENGLRFSQFYNTARCWPTRGALLTGHYAQSIRRDTVLGLPSGGGNRGKRPAWAELLPRYLKSAGYRSYHTGKWHIDGMPLQNGFDRSYYVADQGRFFNPTRHYLDDVPLPAVEKNTDFYATIALADHVTSTLAGHAAEHLDAPFFHYLAFAAPHFPLHALPEDIEQYRETYQAGWDVIRAQRWRRQQSLGLLDPTAVMRTSATERTLGPPYDFPDAIEQLGGGEINRPLPWNQLTAEQQEFQATKMAIHAAMVHRMDIEIGRVFDQIKSMGRWDNTLVMFLSDNGASAEIMVRDDGHNPNAPMGSAETYLCLGPGWSTVSNTPFRRHKTWTHEGGISTPFLVSWPSGISSKGEIRRRPSHVIDVVPTLLEIAGAEIPESAPELPGVSLVDEFNGESSADHPSIWWFHDGHKAVRVGDYKAVASLNQPWELYNLAIDRNESNDLAIVQPDKLQELVAAWDAQYAKSLELATSDLGDQERSKASGKDPHKIQPVPANREAATNRRNQILLGGETLQIAGRHAFLMKPNKPLVSDQSKPWIFYAPTLPSYPDAAESWMHQQFLDAGVAVAGIDVGEAYGSPHAFPFFDALYDKMVADGYSDRPALLGRSRGGLWVSSWAIEHPDRVAGIGGIYPVYDFTTYPGASKAAAAYGVSEQDLLQSQDQLNPIKRVATLAEANIPVFVIHGDDDKVVPIEPNVKTMQATYQSLGKGDRIELLEIQGQGHSFWPGFFHCQPLVDFLIRQAKNE
ncbi:sulfatase-like hydrolase/transferase [Neorhodopirellula pilleata]|uniref:Arylsulfatase n=1 Tax=Neorhodopirellula pilleata TaxID=2714738 RepID=A0A5C6A866_9BACT|nr:sulfatase-like hydrolase/transferase [Neorhodopirellula pilleata]TWT95646.1 Arylsulfatase [Neorhodopirellula pilleata]